MTIYVESFLKDTHRRSELSKALSILHNIGFFTVLMECSILRAGRIGGSNIIDTAAIQFGFTSGYNQCVQDIHNFLDTFDKIGEKAPQVAPDYGAIKVLEEAGFSREEIENARRDIHK